MSADPEVAQQQQRQREFLSLLTLTLEIAGLPHAEHGKYFNEGQMDARATAIKSAYKLARQLVVEVSR